MQKILIVRQRMIFLILKIILIRWTKRSERVRRNRLPVVRKLLLRRQWFRSTVAVLVFSQSTKAFRFPKLRNSSKKIEKEIVFNQFWCKTIVKNSKLKTKLQLSLKYKKSWSLQKEVNIDFRRKYWNQWVF